RNHGSVRLRARRDRVRCSVSLVRFTNRLLTRSRMLVPIFRFLALDAGLPADYQERAEDESQRDDGQPDGKHEVGGADELAARLAASGDDHQRGTRLVVGDADAVRGLFPVAIDEAVVVEPGIPVLAGE